MIRLEEMYQCQMGNCGYIYNPEQGDKKGKIPPGTLFAELSEDWHCPCCGAGPERFRSLAQGGA